MTITYPISLPSAPGFRSASFRMANTVGTATSPFTREQQVQAHQGEIWQVDLTLPPMKRARAAEWQAFFAKLRGRYGTFLLGDPDAVTPRGIATGSPVVDTVGSPTLNTARSRVLHTRGWTANVSGILKAGDYLQLGTGEDARLHMNLNDASSDSSGYAQFDIWPALQADQIDGAAIVVSGAKGCFRLLLNDPGWDTDAASVYGFSFAARSV